MTLVFCFEKKGVLRDENDDDSVIPLITPAEFKQYVADGIIQGDDSKARELFCCN